MYMEARNRRALCVCVVEKRQCVLEAFCFLRLFKFYKYLIIHFYLIDTLPLFYHLHFKERLNEEKKVCKGVLYLHDFFNLNDSSNTLHILLEIEMNK